GGVPHAENLGGEVVRLFRRERRVPRASGHSSIPSVFFSGTFHLFPEIDEAGGATGEPTRGRRSEELLRWRGLESRSWPSAARMPATSEATMAARRRPRRARPLGASPPAEKSSRSSCPPTVVRPKPAELPMASANNH